MNDLVSQLNGVLQSINTLIMNNTDPDTNTKLWKMHNVYTALRDTALGKDYDQTTADYTAAQAGLAAATKAANAAIADINAIAAAFQPLITAAQTADKVVGLLKLAF